MGISIHKSWARSVHCSQTDQECWLYLCARTPEAWFSLLPSLRVWWEFLQILFLLVYGMWKSSWKFSCCESRPWDVASWCLFGPRRCSRRIFTQVLIYWLLNWSSHFHAQFLSVSLSLTSSYNPLSCPYSPFLKPLHRVWSLLLSHLTPSKTQIANQQTFKIRCYQLEYLCTLHSTFRLRWKPLDELAFNPWYYGMIVKPERVLRELETLWVRLRGCPGSIQAKTALIL